MTAIMHTGAFAGTPWEALPFPTSWGLLQSYLLVLNVSSLIVHVIHYAVLRPRGRAVSPLALSLVTALGGAGGTMLAQLIWGRRVIKENAWHHVLALTALVLWGVVYGFVYLHPFNPQVIRTSVYHLERYAQPILAYLGAASFLTFVVFGLDKRRAAKKQQRIPEAVMLALSCLGGSLGGLLAMVLFRHKIRSIQFCWGMPLILAAQLAVFAYVLNAGVL